MKKSILLLMLCISINIAAVDMLIHNSTGWDISIKYKTKGDASTKEIKMGSSLSETSKKLPIAGLESITIDPVASMFSISKKPTSSDGKKILAAIDKNKAELTGNSIMEVDLRLSNNAIDPVIKISASEEFTELPMSHYEFWLDEKYVKSVIGETNFNKYVAPIPKVSRMPIVQKVLDQLAKEAKEDVKTLSESELIKLMQNFLSELKGSPLSFIAKAYGFDTFVYPNNKEYIQFYSPLLSHDRYDQNLMTNQNGELLLKQYVNGSDQKKKNLTPILFGSYKIHLMPLKEDLIVTTIQLLELIKSSPKLQKEIFAFKIAPTIAYKQADEKEASENQNAVIVIYPADGKANAQDVLDQLYKVFKNTKGMNVRPRYNAKVNDLIWVSQGDGDAKEGNYEQYYEKSSGYLVYYDPKAFNMPAGTDLTLKHPATGQAIIK